MSDAGSGGPSPADKAEFEKLRAELSRLKAKMAETKDKDIISVLNMRIQQIEAALPADLREVAPAVDPAKLEEEAALKELENIQPPTPKEADEAERLIRQARLEKQRGNAPLASDLIKKASTVAPGSPVVLEALGDDYASRKLTKQARATYRKALSLDPKNVGIERKYAEIVLRGASSASFEDQMRASDSLFMTGDEHLAASWVIIALTAVLPGVGQMVVGKTVKGIVLFCCYAACFVWLAAMNDQFHQLGDYLKSHHGSYSPVVFVPLGGMTVVWIIAIADLSAKRKYTPRPKGPVDRPRPPVDLPFE